MHKDDHFNQKTAQAFLDFSLGDQWKLEEYLVHKKNQESTVPYSLPFDGSDVNYDPENSMRFQFPKHDAEKFKRHMGGDVFRVPQNDDHQEQVKRSKSFLPEVFAPFDLRDMNLIQVCQKLKASKEDFTDELIKELLDLYPKLNYDIFP